MLANNALIQPWLYLVFAGGFVFFVINGLITGNAIFWHRKVEKSEEPLMYWFSVVTSGAGAGFFLAMYFWPNLGH